jgi:predicted ribosome quality control (RQC) complex YloA/Tae2 family protein
VTLRPAELLLVAAELAQRLPGRPLQKVVAAGRHGIAFGFPGAWLLASIDRRFGRLHLITERPAGTGEAAPPFVMQLRKELVGLRFAGVEAVAGERAVALDFARAGVGRRLLIFLHGAGPRLVLLDDQASLLGAFPPPPPDELAAVPRSLPPPRPDDRPSRFPAEGTSLAIASALSGEQQSADAEAERTAAAGRVRRTIERLVRKQAALQGDLGRHEGATVRRRHADLLLAHLSDVPRGAAEVTLPDDYAGGEPVKIALDPARSASDNAAALYHQYRRLQRGRAGAEARLGAVEAELAAARAQLAAVLGGDAAAIAGLDERAAAPGAGRRSRGGVQPRALPYKSFRSERGTPILVGRGAARNDELTFRVARGTDLWLHTRDVPGAHVVVALDGRPIDEGTLLDAATLALWFSPARPKEQLSDEAARLVQADVTYAPRKLVRKPKGAAPGRVSVAGGKTIRIRLEPDRLRRLLATST